jgi:hypothetical protein
MIRLRSQGLQWLRPRLAAAEYDVLSAYFNVPSPFQIPAKQTWLRELAPISGGD